MFIPFGLLPMAKHKTPPKPQTHLVVATDNVHTGNVHTDEIGLERLIFFSDAVFAIAITLLALEIRLPELPENVSNAAMLAALGSIWPKYLSFVISFLVIGSYWIVHHRIFRNVRHYDGRLMLLNLLLLMAVSFVPFPTALLGEHANQVSTILYAFTMAWVGCLTTAIFAYASAGGRLLEEPLAPSEFRQRLLRALIAPLVFLFSVGVAFWNPNWAQYSWLLIAILSLAGRLQRD
ncbi:MAG: TMEM175 family protein [Caldilineaceae bacterium]